MPKNSKKKSGPYPLCFATGNPSMKVRNLNYLNLRVEETVLKVEISKISSNNKNLFLIDSEFKAEQHSFTRNE